MGLQFLMSPRTQLKDFWIMSKIQKWTHQSVFNYPLQKKEKWPKPKTLI